MRHARICLLGTMEFVHTSCLQNWIAASSRLSCEICKHRYRGRKKYKYGVLASILPYVKARWHQPKINFSLLILFHLVEQLLTETRDFYYRSKKHEQNIMKYRLFTSVLLRWLNYLMYPQTFVFMLLAFRDWSAWRRTQIVFMLDRRHNECPSRV